MIVHRLTFRVKAGYMGEAVELVKTQRAKFDNPDMVRIYTPNIGPFDILAVELGFENLAELEKAWAEWWSRPENAEYMRKWNEVVDAGGSSEVWNLKE